MNIKLLRNGTMAFVVAAGASIALGATSLPVKPQQDKNSEDQATLQKEARISMEKAREIALKRAPGTVESSELEREHGKLVYSFDIRTANKKITEVQVSAISGKVLRIEHENAKQEAAEKRKESESKKY